MYVDITDLVNDGLVAEKIILKPLGAVSSDEFGIQEPSTELEIVVTGIVTEKMARVMDGVTGSYMERLVYHFYIPTHVVYNNELTGATLIRETGEEYIVTSKPIVRKYVSHCVVEATNKKV